MTVYLDPITDRSATDIAAKTAKAFFNVADWARIYGNAQVAKVLIETLNAVEITFTAIAEPTIASMARASAINTLCANIENIRAGTSLPEIVGIIDLKTDWGTGPTSAAPYYITVNQWEAMIDALRAAMVLSVDYRVYCGVAVVGQARFWQSYFRVYTWVENDPSPTRHARTGVPNTGSGLTHQNKFRRYS
jgi:hypothetical protein